jgi:cytidylate kinase
LTSKPPLQYRDLLADLAAGGHEFVVIGSSALALQGWDVSPGDLDLLAAETSVEAIRGALSASHAEWIEDGDARRLECVTDRGPVDVYVKVSGPLSFDTVVGGARDVRLADSGAVVRVGAFQHVRDMRAAAGREKDLAAAPEDEGPGPTPRVIAVDGPAGAGKSTVTRALGKAIGFDHLDTGAMYRCVALAVLRRRADPDDREAIGRIADGVSIEFEGETVLLDGEDVTASIRTAKVTAATPHFAAFPEVRTAMVSEQRRLFASGEGYVAEGRDITTVVAPDAPLKIFLTASLEERAKRRALEFGGDTAEVLRTLSERDRLDSEREVSALKVADDAVIVDTTGRVVSDVVEEIVDLARRRGLTGTADK